MLSSALILNQAVLERSRSLSAGTACCAKNTMQHLRLVPEIDPNNQRAYYHLGHEALLRGETNEAIPWLAKARQMNPRDALAGFFLGQAYSDGGDMDAAVRVWRQVGAAPYFLERSGSEHALQTAIMIDPGLVEAYYELGDLYWGQYRRDEAVSTYEAGLAIEQRPTVMMWLARGRVSRSKQRWDDAVNAYEQGIDLGAGCDAYQRIGYIFVNPGNPKRDLDKAIEWFKRGTSANPGAMWCYLAGGETFLGKGDYEQAMFWFMEARERFPDSGWPPMSIGRALRSQGKLADAAVYYQESIDKGPGNFWPHYYLGQNLLARGDVAAAIARLQTAVSLSPDKAFIHLELAKAYEAAGQLEDAVVEYHRVIELEPHNQLANDRLAELTGSQ